MDLEPTDYPCPDHGNDLTALVLQELQAYPVDLAAAGPFRARQIGRQPFLVLVTCSAGDGHDVPFEGTYR